MNNGNKCYFLWGRRLHSPKRKSKEFKSEQHFESGSTHRTLICLCCIFSLNTPFFPRSIGRLMLKFKVIIITRSHTFSQYLLCDALKKGENEKCLINTNRNCHRNASVCGCPTGWWSQSNGLVSHLVCVLCAECIHACVQFKWTVNTFGRQTNNARLKSKSNTIYCDTVSFV